MELLLQSQFPQFRLFSPDEFIGFLRNRGVRLSRADLEFYDKKGIIRPALRLNRPIVNQNGQKYASMYFEGTNSWKELYKDNLIEFSIDGDFKPWKNFLDESDEKTWQYYHSFQFVPIRRLIMGSGYHFSSASFENNTDYQKLFEQLKKDNIERLKVTQESSAKYVSKIGLLMLLEEPYAPYVKGYHAPSFDNKNSLKEWHEWKKNYFKPKQILESTGLSVDDVKHWYEWLTTEGYFLDPLADWSSLLTLIRRGKKRKLKDDALLAQDYYDLAKIVAFFIKDLTGEVMTDPDEWGQGNEGWKSRFYGSPFDPSTGQTQTRVLDDYLKQRPIKLALVYEGETEDVVIKKILSALYIDKPENIGLVLHPAKGSGNITTQNLDGLITLAEKTNVSVFVIVDKDAELKLKKHIERGTIKPGMYHVWKNDFEYDNFGVSFVVNKINQKLSSLSLGNISEDIIKERMATNNISLMKAVHDILFLQTKKPLDTIISKPDLALQLIEERTKSITAEYNSNKWKPQLPIEHVLSKILSSIPRYVDSSRD